MSSIFIKLLNLSINASWLILAILLLRPLLRKAPKWIYCAMWAIVALRLLLPFSIESALSVLPGSEVFPQDIVTTKTPAIHSQIMAVDNAVNPFMLRELAPKVENSVNPMQVIAAVVSVVWIVGVGVCLIYALISYLLLKRKVSASVAMGDGIMACDEIKTPFILGIIKPMIYVPSSMTGRTLEVVLAHEQAHLKRMDHLWKPLGFLLFSVYWFNPLCLIAYVLLCRDIEAACDEKVIRNRDKNFAADYSQALLDLSLPRRMITVCPLAFGETGVKGRVRGVLNYRKPAFWVTLIALLTCMVVAICFMTSPVTKITKDEKRITSIKVFDGTCGKELIITDRGEIEKIVAYVNEMNLHRGKVSLGYMGYRFHLTFQPKRGTWDDFIISSNSIRNDPFFYSLETESDLEDYIEELYVSHGIKEPSKGEEWQAQDNNTAIAVVMEVSDITPTGLTVHFRQYEKRDKGELIYGDGYWIERLEGDHWVELPAIPENYGFNDIGYFIPSEGEAQLAVDWEWLYGKLDSGTYRITKDVIAKEWSDPNSRPLKYLLATQFIIE